MGKKYGPLPLWAWGLAGGVVLYLLYRYYQNSSGASSTASTTGILDPNAVDPNTGLTYGEEEAAALNANAASIGTSNGGGSTSPTESAAQTTNPSLSQELSDFQALTGLYQSLQQTFNPNSVSSTNTSPTTAAAAASPPMQAQAAPPTINVTVNSSPAQTATPTVSAPASVAQRMSTGALRAAGAILAPFGATKPNAPAGYHTIGTGSGNWQFIPNPAPPQVKPPKTGTQFGGFRA